MVRVNPGMFIKNLAVFIAALWIGGYIAPLINNALALAATSLIGILVGYLVSFSIYALIARWFKARAAFD